MGYSEMLREILRSSRWTQEELATNLGVSFATVNSWLNGRTKPQKSLIPDIERLYLAQDITRENEPIYITIINAEENLAVDDMVLLEKDTDNDEDDEAIKVQRVGVLNDEMWVANSTDAVIRGTRSAGRIYDRFKTQARGQIEFVFGQVAIARIMQWNVEGGKF